MNSETVTFKINEKSFLDSPQYLSLTDFLTTKKTAEIIHKSPAWLEKKRIEGGGIPFRKIGHHVLYSKYDVFDFLYSAPVFGSTSDGYPAQTRAIEKIRKGGKA
jgi:hypothetical protein